MGPGCEALKVYFFCFALFELCTFFSICEGGWGWLSGVQKKIKKKFLAIEEGCELGWESFVVGKKYRTKINKIY